MDTIVELIYKKIGNSQQDFDLEKYLTETFTDNYTWLDFESFLMKVFPDYNIEKIASDIDNNIVYMGRECDISGTELYKFNDIYLIYEFQSMDSVCDLDANNVLQSYDSYADYLTDCVYMKTAGEFDVKDFTDTITDTPVIISVYDQLSNKEEFMKNMSNRYDAHVMFKN